MKRFQFSPISFNPYLWLEANSVDGSDGSNILWLDKSGNANHTTSTGTNPYLKKNIIRGHSVIRFNGSTNFSHPIGNLSEFTLFMVVVSRVITAGYIGLMSFGDPFSTGTMLLADAGSRFYGTYPTGNSGTVLPLDIPILICMDRESGAGNYYTNNNNDGSWSSTQGQTNHLGGIGGQLFNGDMAEVILYRTKLQDNYRRAVAASLMSKYGI